MSPQRGSALAMAMILLSGIAALALASSTAAIAALALAGHQQQARLAFEAAEAGIERALARAAVDRGPATGELLPWPDAGDGSVNYRTSTTLTVVPGPDPEGFSLGDGADVFAARHFVIDSRGAAGRAAAAHLEQGFYLVVPGS